MSTTTAARERPILFSGAMVQATLDDTKGQTRRVIKPQPVVIDGALEREYRKGLHESVPLDRVRDAGWWFDCPYGAAGDRLWVRETWAAPPTMNKLAPRDIPPGTPIVYRAGCRNDSHFMWRPSIFLPRWASRLTLEIVSVRVERVQDISTADAVAEGCPGCRPHLPNEHARVWYRALWDSINAKRGYSWESNPWVWAITFRRV